MSDFSDVPKTIQGNLQWTDLSRIRRCTILSLFFLLYFALARLQNADYPYYIRLLFISPILIIRLPVLYRNIICLPTHHSLNWTCLFVGIAVVGTLKVLIGNLLPDSQPPDGIFALATATIATVITVPMIQKQNEAIRRERAEQSGEAVPHHVLWEDLSRTARIEKFIFYFLLYIGPIHALNNPHYLLDEKLVLELPFYFFLLASFDPFLRQIPFNPRGWGIVLLFLGCVLMGVPSALFPSWVSEVATASAMAWITGPFISGIDRADRESKMKNNQASLPEEQQEQLSEKENE